MGFVLKIIMSGALVASMLAFAQATAQARTQFEFCGVIVDSAPIPKWGPIGVQAKRVTCNTALIVAEKAAERGYGKWNVGRWYCQYGTRSVQPGVGADVGKCKRGSKVIKFSWGA